MTILTHPVFVLHSICLGECACKFKVVIVATCTMAAGFPKNTLTTHHHFTDSYDENRYLQRRGLKTRMQTQNAFSLSELKRLVPVRVRNSWPNSVRTNWRAPYVNHIVDEKIDELYVLLCLQQYPSRSTLIHA